MEQESQVQSVNGEEGKVEMVKKLISGSLKPVASKVSLEKAIELSLNAERMTEQRMGAAIEWAFQQAMKSDGPISELKTQILSTLSHLMRCSREYSKFQTLAVLASEFEEVKKKYETIEVMEMPKSVNVTVSGNDEKSENGNEQNKEAIQSV